VGTGKKFGVLVPRRRGNSKIKFFRQFLGKISNKIFEVRFFSKFQETRNRNITHRIIVSKNKKRLASRLIY
jgi:hypothetical protein